MAAIARTRLFDESGCLHTVDDIERKVDYEAAVKSLLKRGQITHLHVRLSSLFYQGYEIDEIDVPLTREEKERYLVEFTVLVANELYIDDDDIITAHILKQHTEFKERMLQIGDQWSRTFY